MALANAIGQTNFSSIQTEPFDQCVEYMDEPNQFFNSTCLAPKHHHITKRAKK